MVVAGEASGDLLAAELVRCLRLQLAEIAAEPTADVQPLRASLEPRFFGAGGPRMAAAGVDLAFDLTAHAVTGLTDVLTRVLQFNRLIERLRRLAAQRQPDAIVLVDFSDFNRRLAHRIRHDQQTQSGWFHGWRPKIIKYVSPQVWASREGRVRGLARDHDLLLTIFPFEQAWYARRVPGFHVEFVGHPMLDRYADIGGAEAPSPRLHSAEPSVLLLPGSRTGEIKRHLPVMGGALNLMRATLPNLRARMVLPHEDLARQARTIGLPRAWRSAAAACPKR